MNEKATTTNAINKKMSDNENTLRMDFSDISSRSFTFSNPALYRIFSSLVPL
jgi:hypothetical protein